MEGRIENNKKERFILREVLHKSKKGTIINKAITMVKEHKYSFFVIKRIPILLDDKEKIKKLDEERDLAKTVEHSNFVRYYDGFICSVEDQYEYWEVLEYCSQKSVDLYTIAHKSLTDGERFFFLCDLSVAMEYMVQTLHKQHFMLNPHNLILTKDTSSPIPKLKVTNYFENVLYISPKEVFLQNMFYCAPELYLNQINENSDIWSLGVLIFVLFCNRFPFPPNKVFETLSQQKKIDLKGIEDLSLKDLLSRMLIYNPKERMQWDDFFIHPFIQRCRDYKVETSKGTGEDYIPKKIIGKGAFGVVFLAEHQIEGNIYKVALKEVPESKKDSLLREARVMKLCVHPNVVEFHDYFECKNKLSEKCTENSDIPLQQLEQILPSPNSHYFYLVMEYCDQGTLEKYLEKNGGPLSTAEILHFLAEIASGLWYLHFCKHIIHRDLKLENFLLCTPPKTMKYPRLKIADYGLSRAFGDDSTLMQTNVGTFIYLSPEIKYHKVYTTKSDLYSLGVVLYRLATNEYPFSTNKATIDYAFQTKQPLSFPSYVKVEFHLQDLIRKLITHDEASRLSWREFFAHQFVYRAMQHHAAQACFVPTAHDFDLLEKQQIYEID
ncbi:hypothetical protein ENUP19_0003G0003 [Entamoeba nuttalli]|uniref:Serine/threonine protein kinase, putative n=2 Tax=Entamoeba nuttalli TaxID=412467 RepID=K2GT07_ENTNP|nr:serine/threonine protein kinase, putative [Entamoeba nuttalli P19]EKE38118.1 serine/threonine protein kinase, putative [Entamoeba nuttalli P19]|eukprot:XP_008859547.1 serine/threonine protein kinase, putative [Entamoeba nuttalli P19]